MTYHIDLNLDLDSTLRYERYGLACGLMPAPEM